MAGSTRTLSLNQKKFNRLSSMLDNLLELEDETNASWIQANLNIRECKQFVLDKKADESSDDPKCGCGKRLRRHYDHQRGLIEPKGSWSSSKHTDTSPTDTYGEIDFVGAKSGSSLGQKRHKFIRVDHTTETDKLLHLLKDEWHLGTPKLLISVTGGALNFNLNSRLRDVFRKGIIKAAVSTGAWIITGGTHAGVMKYVGEAVKDYQLANSRTNVVAIGIASWGILDQKEEMQNAKGQNPAVLSTTKQGKEGFCILLDPNHTHFILVDNGTTDQFGVEIDLRGRLERGISTQTLQADTHVPLVCVVVEGGPNTISTVYTAIKNNTPIVVVANSGRAADVLAFAILRARPTEKEVKDGDGKTQKDSKGNTIKDERAKSHLWVTAILCFWLFLAISLRTILILNEKNRVTIAKMLLQMKLPENQLDKIQKQIDACLQKPHLLNVYEEGSGVDIDGAILNALMKANLGKRQDQLRLAQAWNRVDIAKNELFGPETEWEDGDLNDAMHYALLNNQVAFVKLFLENGLSPRTFLTVEELTDLYNQVKPGTILHTLLMKRKGTKDKSHKFTLQDVARVIKSLAMDTYQPKYLEKSKSTNQLKYTVKKDAGDGETNGTNGVDYSQNIKNIKPAFKEPIRELFLFAILNKYDEMSHLFWEEGQETIAAALTASKLLKGMEAAYKTKDVDVKEELLALAEEYESLATGVLNECFTEDEGRTADILIRELPNWGRVTCVNLAVAAENRLFIAHSGVQNLLTEIWLGKLSSENHSLTLWACTFFPLLIPFVVRFREDEDDDDDVTPVPTKNANSQPIQAPVEDLQESVQLKTYNSKRDSAEGDDAAGISSVRLLTGGNSQDDYLATGNVDIRDSGKDLTLIQRFILFYDSPKITFRHNVIFYCIFLTLFSYIMLSNKFTTPNPSVAEYVLIGWVFSLFVEEFRQIAQGESLSWKIRLKDYFFDSWNQVDLLTLIMFAMGVVLRFFENEKCREAARIILALDLFIFFLRLLNIFTLFRNIGPKLVMIARMFVDLSFFICILFVFLLGYGITVQAILYPHVTDATSIVEGIFYRPYFQIYGELFLEDIRPGEGECSFNSTEIHNGSLPCPTYPQIGILLLAIYMILSNVLLLNLLIAMFSYTFEKVQENTDLHWKFNRYGLIKEYFNRPPLVPPLILVSHIVFFIRFLLHKCDMCRGWKHGELKQNLGKEDIKKLVRWEAFMSEECILQRRSAEQQDINEQVRNTSGRVGDLLEKMEMIFADPETGIPSKSLGLLGEKALQDRLNKLEDQLDRTNTAVDWVITALTDNDIGAKIGLPELKEIKPREETDEELAGRGIEADVPTTIEELGIMVHVKARSSPYPNSAQERFFVPTEKVPWEVDLPGYKPTSYTHNTVLKQPFWADIDILSQPPSSRPALKFNEMDEGCKYDRKSHMGKYEVVNGIPRNPKGRTGMVGRGLLGRFGPNHAADPIVTRWQRRANGEILVDSDGKKVLEFVAVQRKDNEEWAIPGGMVDPGEEVSLSIKREFGEEALGSLEKTREEVKEISAQVEELFKHGKEVYRGYVDDPRNTDNAWMETVAMNFHDDDGTSVGQLQLQAGDDAQGVQWQRISSKIPLFASHTAMLKKVAELHDASF